MAEITNAELTELHQDIELADAYKRLRENKDFKKLVEELYLDGGSINLTKNLSVVKDQDSLIDQFKARSFLYRFFMEIEDNGHASIEALRTINGDD